MPTSAKPLSIPGWLMRGAIREDDVPSSVGSNPQDDPYNPSGFYRVFSHFYDPANNRPLNVGGIAVGTWTCAWPSIGCQPTETAPTWAMGSNNAFTDPTPNPSRRNHFTVFDAREAMYRALTGKTKSGGDAGPNATPATASIRKAYWATTFRALGDIVHLNQDMSQPQHTRNDPHAGSRYDGNDLAEKIKGHKSFFENYIEARATGGQFVANGTPVNSKPLTYGDYPIPAFAKYSDYWSTAPGTTGGNGLADYSNRGFFSAGTNLGHNSYASPSNDSATYGTEVLPAASAVGMSGNTLAGDITFKTATVSDTLNPGLDVANQKLTTYGAWDQFLLAANQSPAYTLNYYNYDAMADLLIPRAVSYSTGLINYFFRGKLEISLPDEGVYGIIDHFDPVSNAKDTGGFTKLKLKVKNVTPKGTGIEPMSSDGKLVAVVKFHRNHCYQSDLSGEYGSPGMDWRSCRGVDEELVVSSEASVPSGINADPSQVTFLFPTPVPINATDLILQVVYRGPLGDEPDAVVAVTRDISEPTYFHNYSRWDQYLYHGYWPSLDYDRDVTMSYVDWCTGSTTTEQWGWFYPPFPTVEACNVANGPTLKMQYSPSTQPIPGYDPATASLPMGYWFDLSREPPMSPVATLVAPVGNLARIAVLLDAVPSNMILRVFESIDTTHQSEQFAWLTEAVVATINQRDLQTDTLTPSVQYLPGRGVYLPSSSNALLISGNANPIPLLVPIQSQISPNW